MAALVLREWMAQDRPVDAAGHYIVITGRESGVIAWLLAVMGVDPVTTIRMSVKRVEFRSSSLSGTNNKMIPLQGVCSTYYGYHKPWKKALVLFAVLMWLFVTVGSMLGEAGARGLGNLTFIAGTLVSLAISLTYYLLNRTTTFGFVEYSGLVSGIKFKRSVIENIDVNEEQASYVCALAQAIIEKAHNKT